MSEIKNKEKNPKTLFDKVQELQEFEKKRMEQF